MQPRSNVNAKWLPRLVRVLAATLAVAFLLAGSAVLVWRLRHPPSEYRRFESPDGRFQVVVYAVPSLLPVMPGQGGDASGFVRLEKAPGKVLQQKNVSMVNSIDQVKWEKDRVVIWLFAEWDLPQEPAKGP
ncbi:MAG: hypothetical protein IT186_23550 [Acidobacteria bacterium]|nr:hypothetical protein [Acidobacteriota bacterium]